MPSLSLSLAPIRPHEAADIAIWRVIDFYIPVNDSYIFEVTPAERLVSAYQDDDKLITLANAVSALATPSRWSIVREMKIGSTLKMSLAVTVPKIIPPVSQHDRSLHVSPPPHMKTTRRLAGVQAVPESGPISYYCSCCCLLHPRRRSRTSTSGTAPSRTLRSSAISKTLPI